MAKKKSKTQKFKKNLKRKMNKASGKISTNTSNVINIDQKEKKKLREALAKEYEESLELPKTQEESHKKIVEKDQINYNLVMEVEKEKTKEKQSQTTKQKNKPYIKSSNTNELVEEKYKEEKKEEIEATEVDKEKVEVEEILKQSTEVNENPETNISLENNGDIDLEETKKILKEEIKEALKEEVKKELANLDAPQKIVSEENLSDITSPFIGIIKNNNGKKKKTYLELVISRIKKKYEEYKIVKKKQKEQKMQEKQAMLELPKLKNKNNNQPSPKTVKAVKKDQYYDPYEIKETKKPIKHRNIFIKLLLGIHHNSHIIFNSIGILIFIVMIIGLVRIKVYEANTVIYISCIIGFLLFVAVSFNKYLSGKILTLILSAGMIAAIYYMQYTYDFIRNLNTSLYEYKTYYVVTFDNGGNKSIYNINNKKVGLLKDNCINIERKLNTKIEPIYIEYEDINELFNDFYGQNFRAILVNENQYKYLKNNIQSNRNVKVLYEFEANAKK